MGAIVVGSIVALVAGLGWLGSRSAGHPGSALPVRTAQTSGSAELVFGVTTPRQMRQFAGLPKAVQGRCWIYPVEAGRVGSIAVATIPSGVQTADADALKVCFYSGVLTDDYVHGYVLTMHRRMWSPGYESPAR